MRSVHRIRLTFTLLGALALSGCGAFRSHRASLERLHAVAAMARIDPAFFRDALRSASEDPDHHVADVAKRALRTAR